jgi:hypothetical protein
VVIEMPQEAPATLEAVAPPTGSEQEKSDKEAQDKIDDLFKK